MIVALSQNLKSQELLEQRLTSLNEQVLDSEKSKQALNEHIESLSQQILSQV